MYAELGRPGKMALLADIGLLCFEAEALQKEGKGGRKRKACRRRPDSQGRIQEAFSTLGIRDQRMPKRHPRHDCSGQQGYLRNSTSRISICLSFI